MKQMARSRTYELDCRVSIARSNLEVSWLTKRTDMQVDHETLRRKHEELGQAFREKSRKQLQTQELYDKLKRRAMLGQVQNAASDAVDHTIQASVEASRFVDRVGNQNQRVPPPLFSNSQSGGMQHPQILPGNGSNVAPQIGRSVSSDGAWPGFSSHETVHRKKHFQILDLAEAKVDIRKSAYADTVNS